MMRLVLLSCLVAGSLAALSDVTQNFDTEVERSLQRQVTAELKASYIYLAMGHHFGRADVALPGFAKFFHKSSEEERKHGVMFMDYLNKRGGTMRYDDIVKPGNTEWEPLDALEQALRLERKVNNQLITLHTLCQTKNDMHCQDFLDSNFMDEQVQSIKELADMITKLRRAGEGLGEFIFDKEL